MILRNPPGCAPSECDVFVGIDTNSGNSDFLDIYLEGQADGWVAVGFSATSSMVRLSYTVKKRVIRLLLYYMIK